MNFNSRNFCSHEAAAPAFFDLLKPFLLLKLIYAAGGSKTSTDLKTMILQTLPATGFGISAVQLMAENKT